MPPVDNKDQFTVDLDDLGVNVIGKPQPIEFGSDTRDINALRARSLWLRGSVRLLNDLLDVTTDCVQGIQSDHALLAPVRLASPSLLRSADIGKDDVRAAKAKASTVHRVWVTQPAGLGAPIEALTHLLAHSIATQFGEPTTVVTFDGTAIYQHQYDPEGAKGEREPVESVADLADVITPSFLHQFFVAPPGRDPGSVLGPLYGTMHRIVYLANEMPSAVPADLYPLLYRSVRRRVERIDLLDDNKVFVVLKKDDDTEFGPFYCSFIASLLKQPTNEPFATEQVDGEFDGKGRQKGWRIQRDHCRVYVDCAAIQKAWDDAASTGESRAGTFVDAVERYDASQPKRRWRVPIREIIDRWARGVTNRSVGIALSGGGASSYAMVPLLRRLNKNGVPIDVFSGVSGGAFLGAYYCRGGVDGLKSAIADGWLYQLGLLPNAIIAKVGRFIVDQTLGGEVMNATRIRFVPVTIKLAPGEPPQAHRVASGTLGEAVQVSGAAPLLFAPVTKDTAQGPVRYADGGLAMLIPARILRDFGADLLFACNCLPGPANANPLASLPVTRLLYEYTPLGGAFDLWMSAAYMQQRLGHGVNPEVSGFFEPEVEGAPAVLSPFFGAARTIVCKAEDQENLDDKVEEFTKTWRRFSEHSLEDILALTSRTPGAANGRGKAGGRKRTRKPGSDTK